MQNPPVTAEGSPIPRIIGGNTGDSPVRPPGSGAKVVTVLVSTRNHTESVWQTAVWRKSSRSSPSGDNCVEVAFADDAVAVRDTKNPDAAMLLFTGDEWKAFIEGVKAGEFNR